MGSPKRVRLPAVACAGLCLLASVAAAAETDILRLQQQRSQQQMDLQLKMQQQQERASRPAPSGSADAQLRAFEIEQQRRLHQYQDEQSRATAAADAARIPRDNARGSVARRRSETLGNRTPNQYGSFDRRPPLTCTCASPSLTMVYSPSSGPEASRWDADAPHGPPPAHRDDRNQERADHERHCQEEEGSHGEHEHKREPERRHENASEPVAPAAGVSQEKRISGVHEIH